MSDVSSGDRTHEPTIVRLERAKQSGDVARSGDLAFAIQLCGVVVVLWLMAGQLGQWLQATTIKQWSSASIRADAFNATETLEQAMFAGIVHAGPVLGVMMLVAAASWWLQTGPLWLTEKPSPDIARLSPTHWFERLFSLSNLSFPLIGLPRALLAIFVAAACTYGQRNQFYSLSNLPADQLVRQLFGLISFVAAGVGIVLLLTSVADYALRWFSHRRRLRMSDQEIRDEQKMQGESNASGSGRTAPTVSVRRDRD